MSNIANNFGIPYHKGLVFGTEFEWESVQRINGNNYDLPLSVSETITAKVDGSLRNRGVEFITQPLSYEDSLGALADLKTRVVQGSNPFTHRTSTHVHVNCSDLTKDQVKVTMLLYAILEKYFFDYVDPSRKYNIHCVPLNFTLLPNYYKRPIEALVANWSKYTAFNLLPLTSIGTIEFRHLQGTNDIQLYQGWLNRIRSVCQAARSNTYTVESLRKFLLSGGKVKDLMDKIEFPYVPGNPEVDLKSSLIDVKLAFV